MGTESPKTVVLDACVLINFLAIDRVDLLARLSHEFLITDHVRGEVLDYSEEQSERLLAAIADGTLEEISVTDDELVTYAELSKMRRLGDGECSAIAAAIHRGIAVALDDRSGKNAAKERSARLAIMDTQSLVVSMIHEGLLDVPQADMIKADWEEHHCFRLKIKSFQELME